MTALSACSFPLRSGESHFDPTIFANVPPIRTEITSNALDDLESPVDVRHATAESPTFCSSDSSYKPAPQASVKRFANDACNNSNSEITNIRKNSVMEASSSEIIPSTSLFSKEHVSIALIELLFSFILLNAYPITRY